MRPTRNDRALHARVPTGVCSRWRGCRRARRSRRAARCTEDAFSHGGVHVAPRRGRPRPPARHVSLKRLGRRRSPSRPLADGRPPTRTQCGPTAALRPPQPSHPNRSTNTTARSSSPPPSRRLSSHSSSFAAARAVPRDGRRTRSCSSRAATRASAASSRTRRPTSASTSSPCASPREAPTRSPTSPPPLSLISPRQRASPRPSRRCAR